MKQVGMTWQVDPEHWDEYRAIHLNPWPELLQNFAAHGIHNFNCYAFGTRVFATLEIEDDDVYEALAKAARTEVKRRWDAQVTIHVLPDAGEDTGKQFLQLERIFHSP
jgi:L-rhamnose mutarotase